MKRIHALIAALAAVPMMAAAQAGPGYTFTNLGTAGEDSVAAAINDNAGQVAGSTTNATLWSGGSATILGTGSALGINNAGQVVGYSRNPGQAARATFWSGTYVAELQSLGGRTSGAYGINNAGQVAGWSYTTGNATRHATIWNGTSATDLGTLSGTGNSFAFAINSAGQVVGTSDGRATLWNGTSVFDLNSLLDADTVSAGWVLIAATGINDSGWITGNAYNELTDDSHAFLLTAVPEPESYALMLAGLGIVGVAVRRRRVQRQRAT